MAASMAPRASTWSPALQAAGGQESSGLRPAAHIRDVKPAAGRLRARAAGRVPQHSGAAWTRTRSEMRPDSGPRNEKSPADAELLVATGATGLEPATSGVTRDSSGSVSAAQPDVLPAQERLPFRSDQVPKDADSDGFGTAWTRGGRAGS